MGSLFQSFLLMLAAASEKELTQQVQYFNVENALLRSKLPMRIALTARQKQRLIKYGRVLGTRIRSLISIVSPRTFLRWLGEEKPAKKQSTRKPGRPKTAEQVEMVILRLPARTAGGTPASSANSRNSA